MEKLDFTSDNIGHSLNLAKTLRKLQRPPPFPGASEYKFEDPIAQDILQVGVDILTGLESFLYEQGIENLTPLENAYGFSAVVLDAGDKVVRLS